MEDSLRKRSSKTDRGIFVYDKKDKDEKLNHLQQKLTKGQ